MFKIMTVILSLLVAEPAIADPSVSITGPKATCTETAIANLAIADTNSRDSATGNFRTVESFKDQARAMILEVTGEEVADPIELMPLYPATLEGDEPLCGPDDPVDEDGYCAEYYRVKAEIERLTEELSVDSNDANVGCNASVTANKTTLLFLCLMSIALLAMKLKRKRRIFLDRK